MDRSPGFRSTPYNFTPFSDSLSLRLQAFFALNLAAVHNSLVRSTKSTRPDVFSRPATACKHRVSGSVSLPSRGSFHLSLTVLCAIGHQVVFSLGRWASLLPTGLHVPRGTLDHGLTFIHLSPTGLLPAMVRLPSRFG